MTCAALDRAEDDDWGVIAGGRSDEPRRRIFTNVLPLFDVDHDQVRMFRVGELRSPRRFTGFQHVGAPSGQ